MTYIVLCLAVLCTLVAVAAIALPLIRPDRAQAPRRASISPELVARRDRIYTEIRELEFDQRVGKVSGDDYPIARERLEPEAARVLRAIDLEVSLLEEEIEGEVRAPRALQAEAPACPACG